MFPPLQVGPACAAGFAVAAAPLAFATHQNLQCNACVPAGIRKEVTVQGIGVLIFWYRNQLYAIENRYG